MAEITLKNGDKKMVSYNTAAMIYQLQEGNSDDTSFKSEPKDRQEKLIKIARNTIFIDFKKLQTLDEAK